MWARHPVSSGSSWPVIVFGVSLWIGLRPLRPPQSRKRRVRCAKEPTHKPKLRASEKTHQTEGSWTRLCRDTNSSSWAPPLGGKRRKKVPLKLPLPLSLVLFPRGVLAGVLVFLPRQACWQTRRCWLRPASTEDDRHARITRRGRRNAGKALASRPPGSPCSYVTPAQARPMGSTSHTHEGRGDRCGRGGYDGQTGRWRRPGIDGKHRRCCRAGEAAAGLIRRSVW
jgi:hypothetical protein